MRADGLALVDDRAARVGCAYVLSPPRPYRRESGEPRCLGSATAPALARYRARSLRPRPSGSSTPRSERRRARSATARSSSCSTARGCASPRRSGSRRAASRSRSASSACSARAARSASCRSVDRPRKPCAATSRSAARTSTGGYRPELFLNARGGALTRAGAFLILRKLADRAGLEPGASTPPPPPLVRDASARGRRRPALACRRCSGTPTSGRRSATRTSPTAAGARCTSRRTRTHAAARESRNPPPDRAPRRCARRSRLRRPG